MPNSPAVFTVHRATPPAHCNPLPSLPLASHKTLLTAAGAASSCFFMLLSAYIVGKQIGIMSVARGEAHYRQGGAGAGEGAGDECICQSKVCKLPACLTLIHPAPWDYWPN